MVFLHIDPSTKEKIHQLNSHIKKGKPTFILVYMEGCGPCNATRPEWEKLKHSFINPEVLITDIDQTLANEIHRFPPPLGFPTMKFIQGSKIENYEDCPQIKKDRTIQSFLQWIRAKTKPRKRASKKHAIKKRATRKRSPDSIHGGRRRKSYKNKYTY